MTVYSEVANSHGLTAVRARRGGVREQARLNFASQNLGGQANVLVNNPSSTTPFRLNLILTLLMLAMVLGYIFLSNLLVSQRYLLGVLKQQFNQISAGSQVADTEISNARDIEDLLLFVQASGMIEAKDTSFILEEGGVALSARRLPVESLR